MKTEMARNYIRWFEEIGTGDVASVGGKNASLGEMVRNLAPFRHQGTAWLCHHRRWLLALYRGEIPRNP